MNSKGFIFSAEVFISLAIVVLAFSLVLYPVQQDFNVTKKLSADTQSAQAMFVYFNESSPPTTSVTQFEVCASVLKYSYYSKSFSESNVCRWIK